MPGKRLFMKNILQALKEGGCIRQATEIVNQKAQSEIALVSRLYAANTFPIGVVSDRQMATLMKEHGLSHRTGGLFEINRQPRGTDADVQSVRPDCVEPPRAG